MENFFRSNTFTFHHIAGQLARIEIWVLSLAILASMLSTRLLWIPLLAAACFMLIRWAALGCLSQRTPADVPVLLLVLLLPVTLWVTPLPAVTFPQIFRLLSGIALYYAVINWISPASPLTARARLRLAAIALLLAGLILSLLAPFGVTWLTGKIPFLPPGMYQRFSVLLSDTIHPNVMAGVLALLLPLGLAGLLFSQKHPPDRLYTGLSAAACLGMLAVLLLTQSRGAWLAFGASALLLVLLRWRRAWLACVLAAILAAIPLAIAVYFLGITRFLEIFAFNNSLGSLQGRLEVWSRAVYMIQDFPLTGIGMGSFGPVLDALYPLFLQEPGSVPHAHNLFLQVAVDLGLPGLVAWLAVFGVSLAAGWRLYRSGRSAGDGWLTGLGAGLLAGQAALVVHGLIDAVTWGMVRPAPLVWALWGIAAAGAAAFHNSH